ncbi:hypothetical protein PHLGIDRAFT_20109 [Phlebiopsis gigantea 11061_1 CR5-6]|uniref:RTA1 like protein n=1 Tax=Phlebiopsis gigantea (strain 11061_1 CR5-6) TaxID=745531 RepID=A0A0C3S683_PHLG1|nr:hypothetical protein PHLGIDRAFT_20109 [Phlebiopsis gigantea 11061_1 CR5-6]
MDSTSTAAASRPTAPITDPGRFNGSPYHYTPTEWICILYIVLFSISGIIHIIQGIHYRLWFLLPTAVLACIGEVLGWSARLWSSLNVDLETPFIMQITTTIIAPTPLVAANFVILGQLILRLGPAYSRLSAKWYTIVFCTCDLIALVIQAVGGASASTAVNKNEDPNKGGHIMLAGIVFQMAAITVYVALASEFILRYAYNRPVRKVKMESYDASDDAPLDKKLKLMLLSLALSSLLIFIRSVYRTIELTDGWDGKIISTEVLFNVLDGAMIALATYTINFLHPGLLLGPGRMWKRT